MTDLNRYGMRRILRVTLYDADPPRELFAADSRWPLRGITITDHGRAYLAALRGETP